VNSGATVVDVNVVVDVAVVVNVLVVDDVDPLAVSVVIFAFLRGGLSLLRDSVIVVVVVVLSKHIVVVRSIMIITTGLRKFF
jgi:hypothetical protein